MLREASSSSGTLSVRERWSFLLLTVDAIVISGAIALAHLMRFGEGRDGVSVVGVNYSYTAVSIVLGAVWIISLASLGGYVTWPKRLNGPSYRPPLRATIFVIGLLAIASLLMSLDLSRAYLLSALPLGLGGLLVARFVCRVWIAGHRARGRYVRRALVVGTEQRSAELATQFEVSGRSAVEVVAITDGTGMSSELLSLVVEHRVDIIVVTEEREGMNLRQLLWDVEGSGAVVWLTVDVPELAAPRAEYHPIDGLPIIAVEPADRSFSKLRGKRVFDIVVSLIALTLSLPIVAVCAALIRLDSRGPIFFRQSRIGQDGRIFGIVKLRTMRVDAEKEVAGLLHRNEGAGPLFKIKDDPRVTRVGRQLRRLSLDELPQLWNVLRGDMSLVGPRPPLPSEVEQYDGASRRRLIVKPGMTGLWQVSGRSDLSWEQGVRLDLFYVENWSLGGDLEILFQTVGVLLRPKGAY